MSESRYHRWLPHDKALKHLAKEASEFDCAHYEYFFSYFLSGWIAARTHDGAHAKYRGAPSRNGKKSDLIEGFSRFIPLLASWISSGRSHIVNTLDGESHDIGNLTAKGLVSGTSASSSSYWGRMHSYDQRVVEASDIALAAWLLRDDIWADLSHEERITILSWIAQATDVRIPDNNWHLIIVFINLVLESLGFAVDPTNVRTHYRRFKSFYRGSGWFGDGATGQIDYYNAWQIHYLLHWISRIDPSFDTDFITSVLREFCSVFRYLIGPRGFPILGRSVCYRLAAPCPLIAGATRSPADVSPGLAHRASDEIWRHFILNGAVKNGNLTQGYYGEDLRLLDNYSGPASCLLSLRSLILLFASETPIWQSAHALLPVENGDYEIWIPEIDWIIRGIKATGEILVIRNGVPCDQKVQIRPHSASRQIAGLILRRPMRPANEDAKYNLATYSSRKPFCL